MVVKLEVEGEANDFWLANHSQFLHKGDPLFKANMRIFSSQISEQFPVQDKYKAQQQELEQEQVFTESKVQQVLVMLISVFLYEFFLHEYIFKQLFYLLFKICLSFFVYSWYLFQESISLSQILNSFFYENGYLTEELAFITVKFAINNNNHPLNK